MNVEKLALQSALKQQMHGRHGSELLQPAGEDVVVVVKYISHTLFNSTFFWSFFLGETYQDTC